MAKYHVSIHFKINEDFADLIPAHRTYVNYLINKGVVDHYAVSMETKRSWVTVNADSKKQVRQILMKSPLYKLWKYEIDELYVIDGQFYRFPILQMN